MLKKYQEKSSLVQESKKGPSLSVIKNILAYSKSVEVKKGKNDNFLIHMN